MREAAHALRFAGRRAEEIAMAKASKRAKRPTPKKKASRQKIGRKVSSQTKQPFEQDVKRRIGQFGGAGEPPIKK
jgi:hypothetical protein